MIFLKIVSKCQRQNSSDLSKKREKPAQSFKDEYHARIAVIEGEDDSLKVLKSLELYDSELHNAPTTVWHVITDSQMSTSPANSFSSIISMLKLFHPY